MIRIRFAFERKVGDLAQEVRGDIDFDGEPFLGVGLHLKSPDELRIIPIVEQRAAGAYPNAGEIERALSFVYGLLAPGVDASARIAANPERAAEAHRAIYDRRSPEEPYDAMMARIASLDGRG